MVELIMLWAFIVLFTTPIAISEEIQKRKNKPYLKRGKKYVY